MKSSCSDSCVVVVGFNCWRWKFPVGCRAGGSRDGRLSRLAEQDEMDYVDDEDYGYEYEYTDYSEDEEEETHHNKPVLLTIKYL